MARKGQAGVEYSAKALKLADEILYAYPLGLFPMAESRDATSYSWYRPQERGIIPLEHFHVSKSLRKFARQHRAALLFSYDENFTQVIDLCAARDETWINSTIGEAFIFLHQAGFAHSAEVYIDDKLIGGVYGLALGGAFFGESMFSLLPNGSKLALGAMVGDLKSRGYTLYDTQFLTEHLASLGGIEIPEHVYQEKLEYALNQSPKAILQGEFSGIDYLI